MIYERSPPTWGSDIKITDTSSKALFMHAATKLHLTPCAAPVAHLLKEHGNTRSNISNVSISFYNQKEMYLKTYHMRYNFICPFHCTN